MAFVGMDIEAVRQLATQMNNKATVIDNLASTLNNMLNNTEWTGSDATNFRSNWSSTHMTSLRNVSQALKDAAAAARTNATEQDTASSK